VLRVLERPNARSFPRGVDSNHAVALIDDLIFLQIPHRAATTGASIRPHVLAAHQSPPNIPQPVSCSAALRHTLCIGGVHRCHTRWVQQDLAKLEDSRARRQHQDISKARRLPLLRHVVQLVGHLARDGKGMVVSTRSISKLDMGSDPRASTHERLRCARRQIHNWPAWCHPE
jgi:hypothetical protein